MLKDISISSTKVRGRPKGRPENKRIRSLNRAKRLNKPGEFVFVNEAYLGYRKPNYGLWSIKVNYWNEGFKLLSETKEQVRAED